MFAIDSSLDSHDDCLIKTVHLSEDPSCSPELSDPSMLIDEVSEFEFEIWISTINSFPIRNYYICLTSKGLKQASKQL